MLTSCLSSSGANILNMVKLPLFIYFVSHVNDSVALVFRVVFRFRWRFIHPDHNFWFGLSAVFDSNVWWSNSWCSVFPLIFSVVIAIFMFFICNISSSYSSLRAIPPMLEELIPLFRIFCQLKFQLVVCFETCK